MSSEHYSLDRESCGHKFGARERKTRCASRDTVLSCTTILLCQLCLILDPSGKDTTTSKKVEVVESPLYKRSKSELNVDDDTSIVGLESAISIK